MESQPRDNVAASLQETIASLLHAAGLRVTQPRISILSLLHQHPDLHIGADEIYQRLLHNHDPVTISTCYRVLHELCHAGLITRRIFDEHRSVYEIAKHTRHDHMVQWPNGAVIEFNEPHLDNLLRLIAHQYGFELLDRQLVLYVRPIDAASP